MLGPLTLWFSCVIRCIEVFTPLNPPNYKTAHCCRPQPAVKISSASTGISLEVATTSPGLQFYSGGLLSGDAPVIGKGGTQYPRFGGFAVETQVNCHCLMAQFVLLYTELSRLQSSGCMIVELASQSARYDRAVSLEDCVKVKFWAICLWTVSNCPSRCGVAPVLTTLPCLALSQLQSPFVVPSVQLTAP